MTPVRVTRRLEFDAGHRLLGHEGKCRNVHGHRYVAEITCTAPHLDAVGRVIDFSVVKAKVGGWIDEVWDHAFIGQCGDPLLDWLSQRGMRVHVLDAPPTAETMAAELLRVAVGLLEPEVAVVGVRLYETPNCWADVTP